MDERVDYTFQVVETTIRVRYADITRLEVDALVSTDDVHLSRVEPNGVAAAIRAAAGDLPRDDARKHALPAELGSVLVTSAGRLGAKYILHAMTFEYNSRPHVEALIPQVLRRVLELATALRVERLALPVLISGRAGVQKSEVIMRMARSLACHLVVEPHSLREITIAIYKGGTPDHAELERKRSQELAPVREQIAAWAAEAAPINMRLALLQQLIVAATGDRELHDLLASRIAADRRALCRLFECPDEDAPTDQRAAERPDSAPRNRQEYELLQRQLTTLLADLDEEADHLGELRRVEKRRLHSLERQAAQQGASTSPAIITEIEDITRTLDQRERQIQQIKEQQAAARQDLDRLERGWQVHHP